MNLVSVSQMYEIDKRAQTDFYIPLAAILEQAGYQIACHIRDYLGADKTAKIAIVVGHGNNALDALIAARYLYNWDFTIKVFVLADEASLSNNMRLYISMLHKTGADVNYIDCDFIWDRFSISLRMCDIIVDGILGIGFTGKLSPQFEKAVEIINKLPVRKIAVDIPSGCLADTGEVPTIAVKADLTLCICLPKFGLFLAPANTYTGQIKIVEINIPKKLTTALSSTALITADDIPALLPQRNPHMHKYQAGKAVVLAGNVGTAGAACLAATACTRIGAGLVDLFTMHIVYPILAAKLTEVLVYPVQESAAEQALSKFIQSAHTAKALLVGPGLGNNQHTKEFLRYILQNCSKPLVLDADALSAAFAEPQLVRDYPADIIITPHTGEFSRLININASTIETNKLELAREFAVNMNVTVVLKGSITVIATPDGRAHIHNCPMENMASAGMGDVLAGIITGLITQGQEVKSACILGTFIHTYTAGFLAKQGLNVGLSASELIQALPYAVTDFKKTLLVNGR